jgi:hypothetical protein
LQSKRHFLAWLLDAKTLRRDDSLASASNTLTLKEILTYWAMNPKRL